MQSPTFVAIAVAGAVETVQTPASVTVLVPCQPSQPASHRRFGERRSSLAFHHFHTHAQIAHGECATSRRYAPDLLLDFGELRYVRIVGIDQPQFAAS